MLVRSRPEYTQYAICHISTRLLSFTAQARKIASNSGSQLLERPPTLWLGQDENLRFWWFWFWNRICANWRTVPNRLAFQVRLFTSKKDLCDKDVDGESASSNEWLQDMGSPTTKNFAEHVWKIWGTERSLCHLFSKSKSLLLQSYSRAVNQDSSSLSSAQLAAPATTMVQQRSKNLQTPATSATHNEQELPLSAK